eukprot:6211210-Pleurochrysis_carterae.AAC.1
MQFLATSPSVALDREAPFGGEGRGSSVPLAFSSEVGTQGKSRVRARFQEISASVGLAEAEGRGLRRARMHFGV